MEAYYVSERKKLSGEDLCLAPPAGSRIWKLCNSQGGQTPISDMAIAGNRGQVISHMV